MKFQKLTLSFLFVFATVEGFRPVAQVKNALPKSSTPPLLGTAAATTGPSSSLLYRNSPSPSTLIPMNMVAGGAERSQGDDYYEGECIVPRACFRFCSNTFPRTVLFGVARVQLDLDRDTHMHEKSWMQHKLGSTHLLTSVFSSHVYRCSYWTASGSPFTPVTQQNCLHWYAFSACSNRIGHCKMM